jgi:hypothetical protein
MKIKGAVSELHAKNRNERFWIVERAIDMDVTSSLMENMPHSLPSEIKSKFL